MTNKYINKKDSWPCLSVSYNLYVMESHLLMVE